MQVSRRDFFEALGLLGLGLCLSGEGFVLAEDSEQPTIRNPRKTGELTADEKGSLWRVFSHIGSLWQTGEHCSLSRAEFNQIIDLKTNRPPSYLTEYQAALERLRVLSKAEGERQAFQSGLVFG
ncbi:MAG: hypothetical protein QNK37_38860 [Acidobacteriota bacterium]|nr:hypothetical protein [Acidobacteriota bacterium]